LLKIIPNYILNYTRAYNLFGVKPLRSHCGHLLQVSLTCLYKQTKVLLLYLVSSILFVSGIQQVVHVAM